MSSLDKVIIAIAQFKNFLHSPNDALICQIGDRCRGAIDAQIATAQIINGLLQQCGTITGRTRQPPDKRAKAQQ